MPIRTSGATTARSRPIRIRKTTRRMIGGITIESQPAASRTSNSTAVGPPTRVLGRDGVRRLADRFDQVEGLGRVRVRFEGRLDQDAGRPFGDRPRDRLDPVRPLPPPPAPPATSARFWDDDVGQRGRARGEALVEQVLAFDRFDFGAVAVFAGQVGREEGEAAAEDQQDAERAEHDPARRDRDPVADPCPEAVGGVAGVLEPVAAHLVGREDRPVERADDQRGDAAGR